MQKKLPVDCTQVTKWKDSDWEARQKQWSRKADGNDREQCREDAEEFGCDQMTSNQAECTFHAHQCECEQCGQEDKLQVIDWILYVSCSEPPGQTHSNGTGHPQKSRVRLKIVI